MSSPATDRATSRLSVLCAGAAREAITRLAGDFAIQTGNDITLDYGTVGVLKNRVAGGEIADIVVVTADAMAELVHLRKIVPESVAEIGRVGVGIAVRSDAPAPTSPPRKPSARPCSPPDRSPIPTPPRAPPAAFTSRKSSTNWA